MCNNAFFSGAFSLKAKYGTWNNIWLVQLTPSIFQIVLIQGCKNKQHEMLKENNDNKHDFRY